MIAEAGHELLEWEIGTHGSPPLEGYDAAIVFGGDQNVGEEVRYPWLHDEYDALRRWVDEGTPLLGVCLGAQTLARALGGTVGELPGGQLAGFYETTLTAAGEVDPGPRLPPATFEALNANAYGFTLPPGAVELAQGPVLQAFRAGERAWAVQFHPEVRRDQVLGWFAEDEPDLPKPLCELEREIDDSWPPGRTMVGAFAGRSSRPPNQRNTLLQGQVSERQIVVP